MATTDLQGGGKEPFTSTTHPATRSCGAVGVLATLSRWRPRVRVPSGPPEAWRRPWVTKTGCNPSRAPRSIQPTPQPGLSRESPRRLHRPAGLTRRERPAPRPLSSAWTESAGIRIRRPGVQIPQWVPPRRSSAEQSTALRRRGPQVQILPSRPRCGACGRRMSPADGNGGLRPSMDHPHHKPMRRPRGRTCSVRTSRSVRVRPSAPGGAG